MNLAQALEAEFGAYLPGATPEDWQKEADTIQRAVGSDGLRSATLDMRNLTARYLAGDSDVMPEDVSAAIADFDRVRAALDATPEPLQERDLRSISNCWQHGPCGWHVYGAGPCFDTYEQAIAYRDGLDREGITWRPQP